MPDLLLELFSEEIPARMQLDALDNLCTQLSRGLFNAGFRYPEKEQDWLTGFVTPRRLTSWIKNLPVVQTDISTELKGPKIDAPEAALQGFLKKNGLKLEQLENRNGIYFANIHQKGKPTAEILKSIIEEILAKFPWPKQMRWGDNKITWVRPLHSILCLFDNKIVPIEFGGIKAGNATYGHRFLSPKPITVKTAEKYESLLEKAHVLADRDKRKAEICKQAEALAAKHGLTVKRDDGLLEEVTGLVEWPEVLLGNIDKQFMDLPPEVLSTSMRTHQKYFSLLDKSGKLAPHFLLVSNIKAKNGGKAIIAGNERVLRARLSDAKFFFEQDLKKPLDEWVKGLSGVIFHEKLGTVADKVKRIGELAEKLAEFVPGADKAKVKRAAELCKADLVTGMVGEFAELQGIMGRYYAMAGKESPEVADAIRDHYKPQGPNDSVPNNPVSICIALADKLDSLKEMFAINEKPTGSKDPFALRRAALGVIRIVLENDIRMPLAKIILGDDKRGVRVAFSLTNSPSIGKDYVGELLAFLFDRLKVQLKSQDIRHDVINAVIAKDADDLVLLVNRAKALQDFLAKPEGANLLIAYRRAANILAAEEKKEKVVYKKVAEELQETPEEKELYQGISTTWPKIEKYIKEENFVAAMAELAKLRPSVDSFFDKVTVNSDNKEIRMNRLSLLVGLRQLMTEIADFSKIEG